MHVRGKLTGGSALTITALTLLLMGWMAFTLPAAPIKADVAGRAGYLVGVELMVVPAYAGVQWVPHLVHEDASWVLALVLLGFLVLLMFAGLLITIPKAAVFASGLLHFIPMPASWKQSLTVGHYWRAALVVFFNYGVDTGTIFKSAVFHEPILWRHIFWRPEPPNGQGRDSRYGWPYYRRLKMNKQFSIMILRK